MLDSALAVTIRRLARDRFHSTICVVALSIGIGGVFLAGITLRNELGYDNFIPDYKNTYLAVAAAIPTGHPPLYNLTSPSFVAELLKTAAPEIRAVARIASTDARLQHNRTASTEKVYWADSNVFELLALPVFAGELKTALVRPDGVVLTRSIARKYFGQDDAVGDVLQINDHPMTVTAVLDDLPEWGSTLESGIFASGLAAFSELTQCDRQAQESAGSGAISLCARTYVRLASDSDVSSVQKAIDDLLLRVYPKFPGMTMTTQLVRVDRVHVFEGLNPGVTARLAMIGSIAAAILLTATVVFVNLSTARALRRAMEVGVRKACGASRGDLIAQFLGESLMLVVVAGCVGTLLAALAVPHLNGFLGMSGHFDSLNDPRLIIAAAAGVLVVGILAGAWPAWVMSAFRPATVLIGSMFPTGGNGARKALVALQFGVLISLLVTALVIERQRVFATRDVLRTNVDEILLLQTPCRMALVTELRRLPGVRDAHCSSASLLDRKVFFNTRLRDGSATAIDAVALEFATFALYGVEPVAGSFRAGDKTGAGQAVTQIVINESAARRFGFATPEDAIGKPLPLPDGPQQLAELTHASREVEASARIIAVIPDFSIDVGAHRFGPALYAGLPAAETGRYDLVSVRLSGRDIPETLEAIDRIGVTTGVAGGAPPDRQFLSQYLETLYGAVKREAQIVGVFAIVAALLACLGLLGLSAATVQSRTREIGIRKAMGAGRTEILRLLLWQFSKPILWANLAAWPITALLLRRWLQGFGDHIDLSPLTFVGAGALTVLIALVTVSGHAWSMARARPVDALRYE